MEPFTVLTIWLCYVTVLTQNVSVTNETIWSEETPGVILEVDKVNSVTVTSIERASTDAANCECGVEEDCIGHRTITHPLCQCREVCARQSGQSCSFSSPCDVEFGLRCEDNVCRGKLRIQITEVTYNFVLLTWESSTTEEHQASVSYTSVYNGSNTKWERVEIGNNEVKIDDLQPDTRYFVKVEEDGEFEIAVFNTKEKTMTKTKRVFVTDRTPNSISLAWEDFKNEELSDYIVEYKPIGFNGEWMTLHANSTLSATIYDLKPKSEYSIRVIEQGKNGKGEISDLITAMTSDGCIRENSWYAVGQQFYEGCALNCVCKGNDEGDCHPRCKEPYFQSGTKIIDVSCREVSLLDDPCCVSLQCKPEERKKVCKYKQSTYNVGEEFYDGCDYRCKCNEYKLVECQPRCPDITQNTSLACDIIVDPNDSCCKVITCEDTLLNGVNSTIKVEENEEKKATEATINNNFEVKISKDRHPKQLNNKVPQKHVKGTNYGEVHKRFSGCEYKNQTYKFGEEYFDGCQSKCICEGTGHISCEPRCPLLSSAGDTCQELPDPADSCCTIMVCKLPGETEAAENLENLNIKIETIEARNATTISLRLVLLKDEESTEPIFQLWYSPVSDSSISWNKRTLNREELKMVKKNVYDLVISELAPNTEYYFRVTKLTEGMEVGDDNDASSTVSMFSNTVSVKTFPSVVETVFQGCFHHNKTYDVGEIFYDGCQYKCICHKGGQFECQDRCEIFIDTVGFENCYWGPATYDPCCIVPHCNNTNINGSYCVLEDGSRYQTGDTWETKEGCTRKICKCVLLTNGTAKVECKGGCPPIPETAYLPTSECPHPLLVTPHDPCICPYIVCSESPAWLTPEPILQCEYKDKKYEIGREFYDECKAFCHCGRDLRVECASIECPHHFPARQSECLEWEIDPNFTPSPPNCCPAYTKCKNDGSCQFKENKILNYEHVPSEMLDCGTECICMNGNITCENKCPKLEENPPLDLQCPYNAAYKVYDESKCCLVWRCRVAENPEDNCVYQGKSYRPSERWEVRKGSMHRVCICKVRSNGRTSVECTGGCPPIPARYREPTPQCARPVLITPDDPAICPYVVCNNSVSAKELQNVNIVSINSTTVKVEFTVPLLFVGLTGQTELYYTTNQSLPRDSWMVQIFSSPNRLFNSENIEYFLNGLKPDTTYFFHIKTQIDALHGGPESGLYKLRMPKVPPATTTTTLPPMIMIDAIVILTPLDSKTVKVSWRTFEPQEKRFIDGLQLKYKPKNSQDWKTTIMIHRDVTSYVIHNLIPDTTYTVELIFKEAKNVSTKLVSAKAAEVKLPALPKDEYDFQVTLMQDKNDLDSNKLIISGIPTPFIKYVHLAKVLFKSDKDQDPVTVYKILENDRIMLKELKPGRRYKVWLNLYLTNGKTRTSNVIQITTKDEPEINDIDTNIVKAKLSEAPLSSRMEEETKAYYVALIVVAVIATAAGFGFILLLIILLKRQATAKAAITRAPSETAYDNPTFKPQDVDRSDDKNSLHP
ncbi:putative epidermal cell surface receptor isoform X1 [Centruroides vittatus]|uniref:putative epidermal cell surface receptor isoform X1 n=1 Tax=Centruroides vittatus TaxID=120091 RepID=UPI0035106645